MSKQNKGMRLKTKYESQLGCQLKSAKHVYHRKRGFWMPIVQNESWRIFCILLRQMPTMSSLRKFLRVPFLRVTYDVTGKIIYAKISQT